MANENKHVVIAYFSSKAQAEQTAERIKEWDKGNDDIKLGGIGILTADKGKIKTRKVGRRAGGTGAKWGLALGAVTGILSGGVTLIGGAVAGAAGGAVAGTLFHKSLGLSDADKARLEKHLQASGAALVVMADEHEVAPTKAQLAALGGQVEDYALPAETTQAITEAAEAQAEAAAAVDEAVEDALPELAPEATEGQAEAAAVVDEAVETVTEETAETESVMATEMPALATEGAEAVAKIVAATNLSSEDAAKLHAAGVEKASDLLGLAATPQGRQELADATGLSNATILAGVKKMDLMRIRGVGVKHGALLLAAGVDTVPELAQRNPKNLHAALANVNADKQLVVDLPTEAEVAGWVETAKAAPRIIIY